MFFKMKEAMVCSRSLQLHVNKQFEWDYYKTAFISILSSESTLFIYSIMNNTQTGRESDRRGARSRTHYTKQNFAQPDYIFLVFSFDYLNRT